MTKPPLKQKGKKRTVKAWAVIFPETGNITNQLASHEGEYVYCHEVFWSKKDAKKRKSWIVLPKGYKVVPVTITYHV